MGSAALLGSAEGTRAEGSQQESAARRVAPRCVGERPDSDPNRGEPTGPRGVKASAQPSHAHPGRTWQILSREIPVLPQVLPSGERIGPSRSVRRSPTKIRLAVVKAEPGIEIRVRRFAPLRGIRLARVGKGSDCSLLLRVQPIRPGRVDASSSCSR